MCFPLSHIACEHALVFVRPDLRCGIRGIHVVAAELRIIPIHQDLSVHGVTVGVHVGRGRGIGARKVGDAAAELANPAEP